MKQCIGHYQYFYGLCFSGSLSTWQINSISLSLKLFALSVQCVHAKIFEHL